MMDVRIAVRGPHSAEDIKARQRLRVFLTYIKAYPAPRM